MNTATSAHALQIGAMLRDLRRDDIAQLTAMEARYALHSSADARLRAHASEALRRCSAWMVWHKERCIDRGLSEGAGYAGLHQLHAALDALQAAYDAGAECKPRLTGFVFHDGVMLDVDDATPDTADDAFLWRVAHVHAGIDAAQEGAGDDWRDTRDTDKSGHADHHTQPAYQSREIETSALRETFSIFYAIEEDRFGLRAGWYSEAKAVTNAAERLAYAAGYPEASDHEPAQPDPPRVMMTDEQFQAYVDRMLLRGPHARSVPGSQRVSSDPRGTLEAVTSALEFIPNDDLDGASWVMVGNALKAALGEDGRDLWIAWSRSSSKSGSSGKADTAETRWKTFKPHSIGAGTLYWQAQQNGWTPPASVTLNAAAAEAAGEPHRAQGIIDRAWAATSPAATYSGRA